ncbi:MAG: hypothetical protein MUE70_03450 [Desulfobacterales bacterium]|nr:hypothetical protein [Desulfobacterales bacterium]
MPESDKNKLDPLTFFDAWIRSMSDLWSDMGQFPYKPQGAQDTPDKSGSPSPRFGRYFESSMNAWQAFASALNKPETITSAYKGIETLPELLIKIIRPVIENISGMNQQWLSQMEKTGKISGEYRFDQLDKDVLTIFSRLYDAEFRKFLNIPQLGLTREYQERINRFFDQYNLLQSAMAEFLYILIQPFEKTHAIFQEKLADLSKKNELSDDPKFYYQAWLKILEREYMLLFKTPEYLSALAKVLNAAAQYKSARREMVNDLLRQFSIPSSTDIEGVYQDLHYLKKRLRIIEKKINN